jgi:hypothetical protein
MKRSVKSAQCISRSFFRSTHRIQAELPNSPLSAGLGFCLLFLYRAKRKQSLYRMSAHSFSIESNDDLASAIDTLSFALWVRSARIAGRKAIALSRSASVPAL